MKRKLKVLVSCEESQTVCKAFRELGHEAYSNDIIECSGGHPEWHLQMDALEAIKLKNWDLVIAHPPCTHLSVSGQHWFSRGYKDVSLRDEAISFFMNIHNECKKNNIPHCIENPISIISTYWRKPDQIINPFQFGHPESKKTCLWLEGLPILKHTNILDKPSCGIWNNQKNDRQNILRDDNGKVIGWNDDRTKKIRSKTYPGIAKAFADQWSEYILNK